MLLTVIRRNTAGTPSPSCPPARALSCLCLLVVLLAEFGSFQRFRCSCFVFSSFLSIHRKAKKCCWVVNLVQFPAPTRGQVSRCEQSIALLGLIAATHPSVSFCLLEGCAEPEVLLQRDEWCFLSFLPSRLPRKGEGKHIPGPCKEQWPGG